jgi:acetyl/propionyl-CoA carboxylase alpha subunit
VVRPDDRQADRARADAEIALKQMDRALATTEVAGATTNLAFLRRLVGHGRFASGDVDTGLIEADLDALVTPPPTPAAVIARAALAAMGLDGDPAPLAGFSLWAPLRQSVRLMQGESATDVVVEPLGPDTRAAPSARQLSRLRGSMRDGGRRAAARSCARSPCRGG